jgi:hypothetical protein
MQRFRNIAINLSLSLASVLVFLALCEFLVFRYVWLASDAPRLDSVDDVIRFAGGQAGIWRVRNEIAAPYRINRQGWNSGLGDYARERRSGTTRIGVVGDSYVEALQVASTDSLAEALGRDLTKSGRPTEVYRFGISGAPLSQYVHMADRAVVQYRPDWIVVVVAHNDFDESFRFVQGRYTSSFAKFRVEGGKVTGEISPTPWRPGLIEMARQSATARFFLYRWQVRPQMLIDLLLPRRADAAETRWAGNVEIERVLALRREIEAVANYAVARLAALAGGTGARLLLVMDGDRNAIYRGDATSPALTLNQILADAAARHGVGFLDMHPVFADHWATRRRRFEFAADGHWNELAHSVVVAAIAKHVQQSGVAGRNPSRAN